MHAPPHVSIPCRGPSIDTCCEIGRLDQDADRGGSLELDEIAYAQGRRRGRDRARPTRERNAISARPAARAIRSSRRSPTPRTTRRIGAVLLRGAGARVLRGRRPHGQRAARDGGRAPGVPRAGRGVPPAPARVAAPRSWRRCTAIASAPRCSLVACVRLRPRGRARHVRPARRAASAWSGAGPLVPIVGRQWAKFLILTGERSAPSRRARSASCSAVEPRRRAARPVPATWPGVSPACRARRWRSTSAPSTRSPTPSGDAAGRVAGPAHDRGHAQPQRPRRPHPTAARSGRSSIPRASRV